jgi:hypothetical protein
MAWTARVTTGRTCDALNARSRAAAERLGFRYEGTFRQAQVVKGRNRDTAWYSMLDREWPHVAAAGRAWLAADNFDAQGRQRAALRRTSTVNKEHLPTDCRPR